MTSGGRLRRLWRRGQRGWPPDAPVAQFPNAPLLVAFAAWIVAALTSGAAEDWARAVLYVALGAWAWLELTDGANAFRRVIGAGGLVFVVWRVADGFGA